LSCGQEAVVGGILLLPSAHSQRDVLAKPFQIVEHKSSGLDAELPCLLDIVCMLQCGTSCQVILGRDYEQQQLQRMRELYGTWASGLQDWPFLQLPFTRFGKAMAARQQLMEIFKAAIAETRELLQQGQQVPGILASLVSAVDEQGNRCA
jgi:hypothetical protein